MPKQSAESGTGAGAEPKARSGPHRRKQLFQRFNRRVTCDLLVHGRMYTGLVTNMSANGLYVRTRQQPGVGDMLRLVLHEEDGELELDVRVARNHRMSAHNTTGIPSGLGLSIVTAPERYFQRLADLT